MLPRLMKNATFWVGVAFVIISLALMVVNEIVAAIGALLGLVMVVVAVVQEARWKPAEPKRQWSDEKKSKTIDLG